MTAKYLIRLDDACQTSNLQKWSAIAAILEQNNVKPIVAVIPDNKDESLFHNEPNSGFWEQVRDWEEKGWTIAMHGYQHTFHKISRAYSIIPFHDRSEFTGLTLESQRRKIRESFQIFRKNNVNPTVWVAPGHNFDDLTLQSIALETDIRTVSDGIALYPFKRGEFQFVPQQLWSLKSRFFGTWTVCLHPDNMTNTEIEEFGRRLVLMRSRGIISSLGEINPSRSSRSSLDVCYSLFFWLHYYSSKIVRYIRIYR